MIEAGVCDTFHWARRGSVVEHRRFRTFDGDRRRSNRVRGAVLALVGVDDLPRSYLVAALRAAVIALVLLGVLALMVLF